MEYGFSLTLERPTSQINFGEEQTTIAVTVTNAEKIAAVTQGKVWVAGRELSYTGGFKDTQDAARWAINEAAKAEAIALKSKEVTVDFEAVQEKVAQAYAKDKERAENEAAERKLRDQLDADVSQHISRRVDIPDVDYQTYWGTVRVKYKGEIVKDVTKAEFLALGRGDFYSMVLAHLQTKADKAEEARTEAETKLSEKREKILRDLFDANETVEISAPSTLRLRVVEDEDC